MEHVFCGARVGGSIDDVDFSRVTSITPQVPNVRRAYGSGGKVWAISEDETQTLLSREQLLAELHTFGGRAFVEQSCIEIAEGRVRCIWLRGAPVDGFGVKREADIARLFGVPLGIELKLGWRVHHFPKQSLSIGWHPKEQRVEHVALGPVEWMPRGFDARDVLDEWLAAAQVLPRDFAEPGDRSTSSWVRWARVQALLRAFGLGEASGFADGKFLEGKALDAYPRAAAAVREHLRRGENRAGLARLFWWLLRYRQTAQSLLSFNSGVLEAGLPALLAALQLTEEANAAIRIDLRSVDALLCEMISPQALQIPEAEMIERWRWPHLDLDQLLSDEL